jgi:1-pyrroline-5-carboxylate dehydrogenase
MEQALAKVRAEFGREYELLIAGERVKTGDLTEIGQPSRLPRSWACTIRPHRISPGAPSNRRYEFSAMVGRAGAGTHRSAGPRGRYHPAAEVRVRRVAGVRGRKSWPEAEADVCEAIDFCEYYARQMVRFASPDPVVQLPGEKDEMVYLPLGAGIIIPPWNFPLAIMAGMTVAALVTGNTVVIKPSSETPTIAAKFAEVLLDAGFPAKSFSLCTGSGSVVGDVLVEHPKTRFISFTGSRDVGLRINELAAKPRKGSDLDQARRGRDGRQGCHRRGSRNGHRQSSGGRRGFGVRISGTEVFRLFARDRTRGGLRQFVEKLRERVKSIKIGPADESGNYMGPVISAGAKKSIEEYIEIGKQEGRVVCGAEPSDGEGYFIKPTVIADVSPKARIFQEEIFGPVLAVSEGEGLRRGARDGQRLRIRINRRRITAITGRRSKRRAGSFMSATCTSTGSVRERWWALIRSAGSTCPARIPKRADRITCFSSYRRSRSLKRSANARSDRGVIG